MFSYVIKTDFSALESALIGFILASSQFRLDTECGSVHIYTLNWPYLYDQNTFKTVIFGTIKTISITALLCIAAAFTPKKICWCKMRFSGRHPNLYVILEECSEGQFIKLLFWLIYYHAICQMWNSVHIM